MQSWRSLCCDLMLGVALSGRERTPPSQAGNSGDVSEQCLPPSIAEGSRSLSCVQPEQVVCVCVCVCACVFAFAWLWFGEWSRKAKKHSRSRRPVRSGEAAQRMAPEVWPYTYSQCPAENLDAANQDPRKQQRINQCKSPSPMQTKAFSLIDCWPLVCCVCCCLVWLVSVHSLSCSFFVAFSPGSR